MFYIRFIRENRTLLQQTAVQKGIEVSIDTLLALDEQRRGILQQVESLRRKRNKLSQSIPQLLQQEKHEKGDRTKEEVR